MRTIDIDGFKVVSAVMYLEKKYGKD